MLARNLALQPSPLGYHRFREETGVLVWYAERLFGVAPAAQKVPCRAVQHLSFSQAMLTQKRSVDMHVEGDLQLMQETLRSIP